MTILIVGLGNPGKIHAQNRHNAGFKCIESFARAHGISFRSRQNRARVGAGSVDGKNVVLARPLTFMNRSGAAVAGLLNRHGITPADLLVIYDDHALPLGQIRIRKQGSAGGHNGMKSVIASLGTNEFPRLRVGIGPPPPNDTISFVLNDFTRDERREFNRVRLNVVAAIGAILTDGIEKAMNVYN